MSKTKKLTTKKKEKDVVKLLLSAKYKITQNDDGTYTVLSGATGATLHQKATDGDLREIVRCMNYINDRHGADMQKGMYAIPVHGLALE